MLGNKASGAPTRGAATRGAATRRATGARRRVVITGIGVITPAGRAIADLWESVVAGRSAVRAVTLFDASALPTRIAAEVPDWDPLVYLDRKEARHMDRCAQFAVAAADLALADAGLEGMAPADAGDAAPASTAVESAAAPPAASPSSLDPERVAVWIGSGTGGLATSEKQMEALFSGGPRRVNPFTVPMMIANMGAAHVALRHGFRGRSGGPVTACATGTNAIGDAFRFIQDGEADVVLAGAAEAAITRFGFAAFCAAQAMSTRNDDPARACRPFDRTRDGFVMGEGAAVLVLEELTHAVARSARIRAEVLGYGTNSDAYHVVQPRPDGLGAGRCLDLALRDAGLEPRDVGYVNAHGTGTPANDAAETKAIKLAFGDQAYHLAVSSTKPVTGHLMGASGAVELAITTLALERGVIPPTINLDDPDPECDLDYVPGKARKRDISAAMSASLGFGGHNAVVVLGKWKGMKQ